MMIKASCWSGGCKNGSKGGNKDGDEDGLGDAVRESTDQLRAALHDSLHLHALMPAAQFNVEPASLHHTFSCGAPAVPCLSTQPSLQAYRPLPRRYSSPLPGGSTCNDRVDLASRLLHALGALFFASANAGQRASVEHVLRVGYGPHPAARRPGKFEFWKADPHALKPVKFPGYWHAHKAPAWRLVVGHDG
jgi:hypothetical protein